MVIIDKILVLTRLMHIRDCLFAMIAWVIIDK